MTQHEAGVAAKLGDEPHKKWSSYERRTERGVSKNASPINTETLYPLVAALGVPGRTPELQMARFYLGPAPTVDDVASLGLPLDFLREVALKAHEDALKRHDMIQEETKAHTSHLKALADPTKGRR